MTTYTITRERLARSPLATGPGRSWKWLYTVSRSGTEIARGLDLLASAERAVRRDAIINGGPYHIVKVWGEYQTTRHA